MNAPGRFTRKSLPVLQILAAGVALAAEGVKPASQLEVFATFNAAGVRLSIEGDANRNAKANVEFRKEGANRWQRALPLARIADDRFAGSIFGLSPGSRYELRVLFDDPDGVGSQPSPTRFVSLSETFTTGSGRTWYVEAGAQGDGIKERPFGRIQQAVDAAGPGDIIVVRAGTYRESVLIREKQSRPGAWMLIRGEPGASVTGAIGALEKPDRADRWKAEGDGLFSTKLPHETVGYVAAGEERLYRYYDVAGLRRREAGARGGWVWDSASRTLYVAMPDGSDPDKTSLRVAHLPHAFRIENSRFLILEGFDIGFFGAGERRPQSFGVLVESSADVVVRRNRIHHANIGIATRGGGAARVLVEDNEIYDTSIFHWRWDKVKATEAEGGAVSLRGGPGQVVRRNKIRGFFNGVTASTWGNLTDESLNSDLDIYDNEFYEIGDDPVEPEGTCMNVRIWGNTMRHCHTAVSMGPIVTGPTYVLRNSSFQHRLTGVKLNVRQPNHGVKYILHNTFVTTLCERRQADGTLQPGGVSGVTLWPAPGSGQPYPPSANWSNGIFLNNIMHGTRKAIEDYGLSGEATFDYNSLYSSGSGFVTLRGVDYSDLAALRKAGIERHGVFGPARFVDVEKGDLRLAANSAEIDRGLRLDNINEEFAGEAPDIGAYESQRSR